MAKIESAKPQPLLVTTAHRGVFFGYGIPIDAKSIRLERARMCVYWTTDLHGVVGLATKGPSSGCRIGPAAQAMTLQDVTAVIEVSPEAEAKWNMEPWN
jgi:hypothetical protein